MPRVRRPCMMGGKIILESIYRACDVQEKYQSKVRIGVLETAQFCAD